jgi:DNA-binding NarL/FixJ family response regulator
MTERGSILVIDDSWLILERIKSALGSDGYQVRTTTGPAGAARHLAAVDLAIVDFHMPGANGREVLAELRAVAPHSSCLFYLYTSDTSIGRHHADHGFDGAFLRKGEDEALLPQVNAVFRTIHMRKLAEKMRLHREGF